MSFLIRAVEVLPPGTWSADTAVDRIVLSYDDRHRRRLRYVASAGTTFLLDLPRAAVLRAGDGLRLEDGRIVRVEASPEQLIEITAPDIGTLVRLAWHIGNRHLPAQLESQRILIREDAVIENMLTGLGATLRHVLAPFTPEAGAYHSSGHGAQGAAQHPHPHEAEHAHEAGQAHQHAQSRAHQHAHSDAGHNHQHPDGGHHHD